MGKARNRVIAGDFLNQTVNGAFGMVTIASGINRAGRNINKDTVQKYQLVTSENRKSVSSGVFRGLIGNAIFGPAGLVLGSLSAKNNGIRTVAIQFRDGKKSLLEVDDKIYKAIVTGCF